ncbi:anti-sigma factor family protein [Streptomyces sp. NPDC003374]
MTATTDTAGHPDVTEISDLTEGLLTGPRADDLRRHLSGCASCADMHASLEEIRGLLGALPQPQSMPEDVALRIDAALAAEAEVPAETKVPATVPHVSRETSAADRPSGRARSSSTGPGRKNPARRGRRRIAVLGSVLAVAALGVTSVVLTSLDDGEGSGTTAHGRPSASAGTFAEGTLQNRVTDLLDKAGAPRGTTRAPHSFGVEPAPGTGKPNLLKDGGAVSVPACVRQGIDDSAAPLAAQPGTYDGKTAYLVVLPDASGDPAKVTAYVVDATCVRHPSTAAKVLLTHSYARS